MKKLAWNTVPDTGTIWQAVRQHGTPLNLIICLTGNTMPDFPLPTNPSDEECRLHHQLNIGLQCLCFSSINYLENILPDVHFWIVPPQHTNRLHEHFDRIEWQTAAITQTPPPTLKPWFRRHHPSHTVQTALIIGAGIAGASTAHALAERGISVTVLEAGEAASGASGNRQGLLYAKISPHDTEQTELLLAGYGYTKRLLQRLLPDSGTWGGDGVIHLNHNETERKRNAELGKHTHHAHLYRNLTPDEAETLAGIPLHTAHTHPFCGLYWQQGVWLNPATLIHTLLDHPLITLHTHTPLTAARHDGTQWTAHTPKRNFTTDCIVYCAGAQSPDLPETNAAALPYRQIRGQTSIAPATPFSQRLRCALSAESYISPAWQNLHCYGASFILNDSSTDWHEHEETTNRTALAQLNPPLAASLFAAPHAATHRGHTAVRCDSNDHLPIVGALGDIAAMQQHYAKLALDKNYRIDTPCPYLPHAYINTAHGTRGLSTAPICAAALAADILNLPHPFSQRLRTALHPNRAVIRAIIRQKPLMQNAV